MNIMGTTKNQKRSTTNCLNAEFHLAKRQMTKENLFLTNVQLDFGSCTFQRVLIGTF